MARAGFNGDEVLFRQRSNFKGVHRSFLELACSFSTDQLLETAMKVSNLVVSLGSAGS
jgi:hypothetical protein